MLGLTNEGFGLFAGTAINDTSSVTAAASAWDSMHPGANVLESATVVKLTRTLAIIPITLVLACWQMHLARKAGGDAKSTFSLKRAFPMFVLFFVLASVITTVLQLPASITAPIKELSKFFIVMAMAAIGFNTDIVEPVSYTHLVLVGMMRAHTAAKKLLSTPPENPIATRPYAKSSCSSADSLS